MEGQAHVASATAQQREAGQQLERIRTLKERGFATNASLDAQVAAFGSARAAAAQAKAAIADRVIRAPFSGWVSLRNVSAGAVIPAGTEIATISDLSQIKLDFSIPETLLATVQERSEEHTSELQSLMRISYAVFCLKKKKTQISSNLKRK